MTDSSTVQSGTAFAHFPRWLPFVGILIGLLYLAILNFAGSMFGQPVPNLEFEMQRLAFQGTVEEMDCGLSDHVGVQVESKTYVSSYGLTPGVFSLRVPVHPEELVLVLNAIPDAAALLTCQGGTPVGPFQQAGDVFAAADRAYTSTLIAFALPAADENPVYLLHIEQRAVLAIPLAVQTLGDFKADSDRKLKIHIGFISVIAFMVIYNFILAALTRMPAFIFNALTMASLLLHSINLNGVGATYLWPNWPELSNAFVAVALAGPSLFGPFYVYRFIVPPEENLLLAMPAMLIWPGVSATLLIASLLIPYHYLTLSIVLWWILFALVAVTHLAVSAWRGNPRAAVLLVVALGAAVPAMAAGAAKEFFGYQFGAAAPHLTEIALLFEALLFTLALAYQIRLSRWREMEAQKELNRHSEKAKQRLLDTIDSDRTRLASDLHDSAGQMLGLISSRLKKTAQSNHLNLEHSTELRETAELASETLAEIRRMSHDLHPATLTHLGLAKAITGLCQAATVGGSVRVESQLSFEEKRLSDQQNLQIYRIFQELVANTMRHSGARDASLSLHSSGTKFQLRFSDNGQEKGHSTQGDGIGRTILRERAARLGGKFVFRTGALGTVVAIEFTVKGEAQ